MLVGGESAFVNLRMRKRKVDQANVNVRLSVNLVWSVQSDGLRGYESVWNTDKRASFFPFCFPSRAPSTEPYPSSAAIEFWRLIDGDNETSGGNVFFSLLLLLLFSSSSPMEISIWKLRSCCCDKSTEHLDGWMQPISSKNSTNSTNP
uniref:Uncharacterized protein n=1 Tax=Nelumbo nucifera TaxID=4432 RepID=A0A823A4Q8_NELNU|nr:TPA_asm: hypothetical protein HUJ06_018805 [Nelumbo nucifera]